MVDICERYGHEEETKCCRCLHQKCIYQNTQSHDEIIVSHLKNTRLCPCGNCSRNASFETYDRFCCGCFVFSPLKCPLYYKKEICFSTCWMLELTKPKRLRPTVIQKMPEHLFKMFWPSVDKCYIAFNNSEIITDVIKSINKCYSEEYNHIEISLNEVKMAIPMSYFEYENVRHFWYVRNKKKSRSL